MVWHSTIAGFLQILARQMIVGGILWTWFTWAQLVMLPDEWMRTAWYLAGAGLVAAGVLIIWSGHGHKTARSPMPVRLPRIFPSITGS